MVNYELPWNPNRIDQRIGRLHRYGQKRDVKVHNFFVANTREGEIFLRLLGKIRLIEQQLGGRLSEIMGVLLEGADLEAILMNALAENVDVEVTWRDIEQVIEERLRTYQQVEDTMLMDLRKFDLESTLKVIKKSQELAASEADIERFVRAFFEHFGGKIERTRRKEVYRLVPPREVVREGVEQRYDSVTFSKQVAKDLGEDVQFVAFGHPLLSAIIDFCLDKDYTFGGRSTIKVAEEDGATPGALFNFILRYTDAKGTPVSEDLRPLFVGLDGRAVQEPDPGVELFRVSDLEQVPDRLLIEVAAEIERLHGVAFEEARRVSEEYATKAKRKRGREIKIKRRDAKRYFAVRMEEQQARLQEYERRLAEGEDMEIAIRGVRSEIRNLEEGREAVLQQLKADEVIIEEAPELLNVAVILPKV